jgi:hypothetical protein
MRARRFTGIDARQTMAGSGTSALTKIPRQIARWFRRINVEFDSKHTFGGYRHPPFITLCYNS